MLQMDEPVFRAQQLWTALHKNHIDDANQITTFSKKLRTRLRENYLLQPLRSMRTLQSFDGSTQKDLFSLYDDKAVESVLMLYHKRRTVCVSTQVGCAMACSFCATGQMGFARNLSRGEIAAQVYYYARELRKSGEELTNVVLMGMGEPFHNYEESIQSMKLINHPEGLNLGARRITVSTVGLVPEMQRYAREKHPFRLAVSLHAATDELRSRLIPINRKYSLQSLIQACNAYTSLSGRRITFEWALIKNVNDTEEQLQHLIALTSGMLCHINLIPLNPSPKSSYRRTEDDRVTHFLDTLNKNKISCSIRLRRGLDIQAGCGQLAVENIQ
jgi:23S rRNA (adenine2503-C2)-methyltransferase